MSEARCRNCNQPLTASAAYCPSCGQSVREISRPWLEFAREMLTELADFDGRMFQSLRLLLSRPGFLSLEYNRGRRVSHTSPIRMYLVISLLFFLVLPIILPPVSGTNPEHKISVDLYSKAMFLLLPVFALLLKILYRRSYYIDHLVFTGHLFSAMFIVFAILLSIETLADRYILVMLIQVILTIYVVAYFVIALRTAYQESWQKSILKFIALLVFFLPLLGMAIEVASHVE